MVRAPVKLAGVSAQHVKLFGIIEKLLTLLVLHSANSLYIADNLSDSPYLEYHTSSEW